MGVREGERVREREREEVDKGIYRMSVIGGREWCRGGERERGR
jgi:hypothetical protein